MENRKSAATAWKHQSILAALVVLAAFQASFVVSRFFPTDWILLKSNQSETSTAPVGLGEDLTELQTRPLDLATSNLPIGKEPLLLAVFSSNCRWSDSIAPAWAVWMEKKRPFTAVAITTDSPKEAQQFLLKHGWNIGTFALDTSPSDSAPSLEKRLANRTPWVFVADAGGRVIFEDHGSRILHADSVIRSMTNGASSREEKGGM